MKNMMLKLIITISVLFIAFILLLDHAIEPYRDIRKDTVAHVKDYVQIKQPQRFYFYNGDAGSHVTVTGLNDKNEYVVAIVEEESGNIDLYKGDDILSEHEMSQLFYSTVGQADLTDMSIGKEKDQAVWEVVSKNADGSMNFHYFDLTSGQLLSSISNI